LEEGTIGDKGESALVYRINQDKEFKKKFAEGLKEKLSIPVSENITATQAGRGYKTDVILFDDHTKRMGLSLKSLKKGARPDNHLDRRWLDKDGTLCSSWKNALNMPAQIQQALWRGIMEKAKHTYADLVMDEDQPAIREFLLSNLGKIMEEVFRRGESDLRLFAVMEYEIEKSLCVFRMDDIIAFVKSDVEKSGIDFGSNIKFGNFLWIQRKAGNGARIDAILLKTDPNHPANQLQAKVLPLSLRDAAMKHIAFFKLDMPLGLSTSDGNGLKRWTT
jgi:uncharacterized protein YuzB (UPF0349 family)